MQLHLFQIKLNNFPILHRLDRYAFTLCFLHYSTHVNIVIQIARCILQRDRD